MNDIEQKLLIYADLPAPEQEEVEAYVRLHPEWAPLLAEARALHALLAAARADQAAPDAATVARYVLARTLEHRLTPEAEARYALVEAAFAEDPALERQARAMTKALERVAAEAEDPVAQFERLTGRQLENTPASTTPTTSTPRILPWRPLRLALAASFAFAALYAALAVAGYLVQPEQARLADLGDLPDAYEGLHLRGTAPADRTADRYALALEALEDARSSVLGLFPRYDDDELDAVAARLREVVDTSGSTSWEGLEALYVLGKIRLYQGQDEEAIWALQSVVALDGPHASEARRLLDYLQREELEDAE